MLLQYLLCLPQVCYSSISRVSHISLLLQYLPCLPHKSVTPVSPVCFSSISCISLSQVLLQYLLSPSQSLCYSNISCVSFTTCGKKYKTLCTCSVSTKLATWPSSFVPRTLNLVPARSQLSLEMRQAFACLWAA